MAKQCGLKQSAVAHIETGRNMNSKYLPQIAAQLGVNYEWLLTGRGDINESGKPLVDTGVRMIPVRSFSDLKSGNKMLQTTEWLPAPTSAGKNAFAIRVTTESMTGTGTRTYPPGGLIIIDPDQTTPISGKRIVFRIGETASFREYREEMGQRLLVPLNPQYPTTIAPDDMVVIGSVIGSYTPE